MLDEPVESTVLADFTKPSLQLLRTLSEQPAIISAITSSEGAQQAGKVQHVGSIEESNILVM